MAEHEETTEDLEVQSYRRSLSPISSKPSWNWPNFPSAALTDKRPQLPVQHKPELLTHRIIVRYSFGCTWAITALFCVLITIIPHELTTEGMGVRKQTSSGGSNLRTASKARKIKNQPLLA